MLYVSNCILKNGGMYAKSVISFNDFNGKSYNVMFVWLLP